MPETRVSTNVNELRRFYEPNGNRSKNCVHKHASLKYRLLFSLGMITVILIFATIIEKKQNMNSFVKMWSNIFNSKVEMILRKNNNLLFWKSLSSGQIAFVLISFFNVAVYLAWRNLEWKRTMIKYFTINDDKSNSILSLLLSAFSHNTWENLGFNLIFLQHLCTNGLIQDWPLSSFSPYMGIEEFFVMYLSACIISSLSRIYIEPTANSLPYYKHGSSGAISAIFGYALWASDFKSPQALYALLCLWFLLVYIGRIQNCTSLTKPMTLVGGCLFGIFWCRWGSKIVWSNRIYLLQVFDNFL